MIHVLLIEDSDSDAVLTETAMRSATRETFVYKLVKSLTEGILVYKNQTEPEFDIILLDLGLPESRGLDTLSLWFSQAGTTTPVVVLSGLHDEVVVIDTLKLGAQDYIMKDEISPGILCRSLRYSIERHTTSEEHIRKAQQHFDTARRQLVEVITSVHKLLNPDIPVEFKVE